MVKIRRYPPEQEPPTGDGGLLLLIQPDPPIWLYSIDLPTDPPTKLRVASYTEDVYFESTSLGALIRYYAMSITHGEVRVDTEGSNPTTRLVAQNLTREMVALVESYGGLVGQIVRAVLIQRSELPNGNPIHDDKYEVLECDYTESVVELTLGRPGALSQGFPNRRIIRDHCGHDYGGPACGYDTKAPGALQTCSKLRDGPNGCTAHNNTVRFLGFLGVARVTGTGVS
jgi:lambda family phage minor tail protein L